MDQSAVKELLLKIGLKVNERCTEALSSNTPNLNEEVKTSPADIIYRIDIEAEEEIIKILEAEAGSFGGVELIAEGIGENDISRYPDKSGNCSLKIICDPIDGSRGLMYGKRAAFFLAAAGPVSAETLKDMTVSVMVELPVPKQTQFDVLCAVKGGGADFYRYNPDYSFTKIDLKPSTDKSVEGGFMSLAKFCYPGKDLISRIEEKMLDQLFGNRKEEYLPVFDDQYISTGGQLYELICGHDRFTADFRASMYRKFAEEGKSSGQVCHPYDMAGFLVAEEAGILITDAKGDPFNSPLTTDYNVDWVGYSNEEIKKQCEPSLLTLLKEESII